MYRYVAFLRGMNLGRRRITNPELCDCFVAMGFANVSAFLASGNIVFDAKQKDSDKLTKTIESGLREALKYEVPTFLRSAREVVAITKLQPFSESELGRSRGKPQVALLLKAPSAQARGSALAFGSTDDRLEIKGRELYWLPSGGVSESELDFKALEKALGPMTIRTRNTLERLAAKYLADIPKD